MSNNPKNNDPISVSGMYENWFLEYASYVILERAVPAIEDGLKPVQRRILHAMKEMDDGRYNKVANIIGQAMQYHPHGDASIGDALVNLGQKDLLIDAQGNWGDIRTGDGAAAARYIEARLSKFALEVIFNPQTTEWQLAYDGRKREPVVLPVKFPLLIAQGVEGIAVGLSTKILPHNFCEIIEASIDILKDIPISILPDFPTGGLADFTNYNGGHRGSRVRVRAKIEEYDKKTLVIKEIPFGTTTNTLIESIIKANDSGKIKIKKVIDNTAKEVEVLVYLAPGVSPEVTIDALYALTDCEVSISPNACIIIGEKPHFLDVNEILRVSTRNTVSLLEKELQIRKEELLERILYTSLEKIFIENKIYQLIEKAETWEEVLQRIDQGLTPFKKEFYREINQEDIAKLTEIKIKRISKFDAFKAEELMKNLQTELKEVEDNLNQLTNYAIKYFKDLLKKYGKNRERKTQITTFNTISATTVAANNQKLYVNRVDGFIGYGIKKDEFVCECSDLDDVIIFRRDGKCLVTKIAEKVFVGKDIIHIGIFTKNDTRMVYNMVYRDGGTGNSYVKRFQILAITRDREYDLAHDHPQSKVLYFTANPNGEAESITVYLTPTSKARNKVFDYDFATLDIKGRSSIGNILTKYGIKKLQLKTQGVSTLSSMSIWYEPATEQLNNEERGNLIGRFQGDDRILAIYKNGTYELTNYDVGNKYDNNQLLLMEKYDAEKIISAIYHDTNTDEYFAKRFNVDTANLNTKTSFIPENKGIKLLVASTHSHLQIEVIYRKDNESKDSKFEYDLDMLAQVKSRKEPGRKLPLQKIKKVQVISNDLQKEEAKVVKNEIEQLNLFK